MDLPPCAFEIQNFEPHPPQEVVCSICYSVLRDPVQSHCEQLFCRSCIYQWLKSNPTCPICRKTITLETVVDAMPLFKSLIMGLKLRCPHSQRGCAAKFALQNYCYHLQQCEYVLLTEEERQQVQPDADYGTRLLKALSDKSLHHLIPKILRTEKESINVRSQFNYTPLLVALWEGCSLETLNVLLDAGAQVTARSDWKGNALHYALLGKCPLSIISKLIQCNKEMVHQRDILGMTPLMHGLSQGCSLEVFHKVVKAGADLTVSDDYRQTHLHWASCGGCCKEILEEIICQKPDLIIHQNKWDRIPLHYARDECVVRTLIDAGSEAGGRDKTGNTPLQWALLVNELTDSTVELYLEHMSVKQVQQVNSKDETLLHSACKYVCGTKLAQRLIKLGLDPAKKNKQGESALHFYALKGAIETCKELLRGYPQIVEIKNNRGNLAIEVSKNTELSKELIKWVSLQNEQVTQRMILAIKDQFLKSEILLYWEKCKVDLKMLQEHRIWGIWSLRDLLLKDYLTEDSVSSARFWRECFLALDFDPSRLSVFRDEVLEIQRKVRGNRSTERGVLQSVLRLPQCVLLSLQIYFWNFETGPTLKRLLMFLCMGESL